MPRRRTRLVAILAGAAVLAAAAVVWSLERPIRWKDARTMPPPLEAAVRAYAKGNDAVGLAEVRRMLERYRAPAWEPRARVLAATHLARGSAPADVIGVLPRDLPTSDPLRAHASLLRARGLLAAHEPGSASEEARRAAQTAGFPLAVEARIVEARALDADGRWREGVRSLEGVTGGDAALAAARIAAAHGDAAAACRRLVRSILAPDARAEEIERLLPALAEIEPRAERRFAAADRTALARCARRLVEDGHPSTAIAVLRAARPAGAPGLAPPPEALVEAEALVKLSRTSEARALLARARTGDAATRGGAAYLAARMAAGEGRYATYRAGLEALGRRGASPWREAALLDLAQLADGYPTARALAAYRRYRLAAGAGADPLALFREGWIAFELGRGAEADAGFARALAAPRTPDGVRAAAEYWTARRDQMRGRRTTALATLRKLAAELPNHYYGVLAARRAGIAAGEAPVSDPPPARPADLGAAGVWLEAARALASVGLWDEAAPCFRTALEGAGAGRAAVASEAVTSAVAAGAPADAVAFAQAAVGDRSRTAPGAIPLPLWRLLFPAPQSKAIVSSARANGLDPDLVAAVTLQESAFNPLAVSSAGARGLMQLLPDVAAELARRAGLRDFKADDLFDPETNLRLGCAHLSDYVRRLGSVPRALAAYNGGPSRVERWTIPKDDDERFVERIPIPETRIYVKRVLANAHFYAIAWPDGLGR